MKFSYDPDYAVSPGEILEEILESQEISQADFAHRCDLSFQLVKDIINEKASIDQQIAIKFEQVLDIPAQTWLNLESNYQKLLSN